MTKIRDNVPRPLIPLTNGKVSIVSSEDYEEIIKHNWHAAYSKGRWEARRGVHINGKQYLLMMHRAIMGLDKKDNRYVDHIDGDSLNNKRENLRICTNQENQYNQKGPNKDGSSGYRGVTWSKKNGAWQVSVRKGGVLYHGGYFNAPQIAAISRDTLAIKLHGRFANLNFKRR